MSGQRLVFQRVPFKNVVLGTVFRHEGTPIQKIDEPELYNGNGAIDTKWPENPMIRNKYKNSYNAFSASSKGTFNLHPECIVEVLESGIKSPKWRDK